MGLPVDTIEGAFCNHSIHGLAHVVMRGDQVAFVPYGTPGPHRYFLGLYEAGHEERTIGEDDANFDAVRNRRSIRRYQARPIEPWKIELLQEAMLRAPSSRNLKPWRFVFVSDEKLLRALASAKPHFAEPIGAAALGVVICADATVSDCWVEDGSIAGTILQLMATDLGLGSCWIQIRARQREDGAPAESYVREVLGLTPELSVLCMISVGYPAEEKDPKDKESLSWDRLDMRPGGQD
jgi:nitroreductase